MTSNYATGRGILPRELRGFTLIELMVVIAVTAVLAGLIFPALSKSKRRAQNAVCLSNFRQLMLSWKMYADEHEGRLVTTYYFVDGEVNTNAWVRGSMNDNTAIYPQ